MESVRVTAGPGVSSRSLSLMMRMAMERSTAEMPTTSSGCSLGGRPALSGQADFNKDSVVDFRDVIAIVKSR
jgi:hypothetical protein